MFFGMSRKVSTRGGGDQCGEVSISWGFVHARHFELGGSGSRFLPWPLPLGTAGIDDGVDVCLGYLLGWMIRGAVNRVARNSYTTPFATDAQSIAVIVTLLIRLSILVLTFSKMPASSCHIVIIGAGLGGLAAGVAVLQAGHRVSILERASALGEVFPTEKIRHEEQRFEIFVPCLTVFTLTRPSPRSAQEFNSLPTRLASSNVGAFSSAWDHWQTDPESRFSAPIVTARSSQASTCSNVLNAAMATHTSTSTAPTTTRSSARSSGDWEEPLRPTLKWSGSTLSKRQFKSRACQTSTPT